MTKAQDRSAAPQAARRPEPKDVPEQLPEQWSPREKSLAALFTSILTRGPISRRDAARDIGMSQAAVTKLVKPMIAHGYVTEQEGYSEGPGRRLIPLVIDPRRHHAIGIKATERELIGVIVDLHAEVRHSARVPLHDPRPEAVVRAMAGLARDLERGAPELEGTNVGVGVGLGGHVDGRSGLVRYSPMLGWRDVPVRQMLADELDLPVVIENDVNSLALAEQWFGAGRDTSSFAVVTVGSGVGGAIVVDGTLLHGVSGAAGELGHTIIDPSGPPCPCGKRGCLETYASDQAILTAVGRGHGTAAPASLTEALELAQQGDEVARLAFADAGRALGQGLSGLVNLINPPLVVLSGEGISASDMFMDALSEEMARDSFSSAAADCRLVVRPLPDETWARGAAAAMLRHGVLRYLMALTAEIPV
jgi:predicted NBD/HSP70 family sugar kinase